MLIENESLTEHKSFAKIEFMIKTSDSGKKMSCLLFIP